MKAFFKEIMSKRRFYKRLAAAGLSDSKSGSDLRKRFDKCQSKINKIVVGSIIDPSDLMNEAIEIAKTTTNNLEQAVDIVINNFQRNAR